MLTGQAKRDYQHKYMTGYMRAYRKNKDNAKSGQKRAIKNALQSPQLNASDDVKVFTGSLHNKKQVFTNPVRKAGQSDNQYAYECYKAEKAAGVCG